MRFFSVAAFFAGLCVALPVSAATVQVNSGELFLDRGNGYKTVSRTASAKPGDTVMAKVGGSGEIIYADGCRQPVDVGSVVTVSETSPCMGAGVLYPDHALIVGGLAVAGVVGAVIAISDDDDDKKCITKCKK